MLVVHDSSGGWGWDFDFEELWERMVERRLWMLKVLAEARDRDERYSMSCIWLVDSSSFFAVLLTKFRENSLAERRCCVLDGARKEQWNAEIARMPCMMFWCWRAIGMMPVCQF